jgi:hypothetical protein
MSFAWNRRSVVGVCLTVFRNARILQLTACAPCKDRRAIESGVRAIRNGAQRAKYQGVTMNFRRLFGLLVCLSLGSGFVRGQSDVRLQPAADNFAKYQAFLRPRSEEENWLQIPWMTDLWEARKKAAAEGKPILLWEMDGSPMACG